MNARTLVLGVMVLLALPGIVVAIDAFPFDDPQREAQFRALTEELRCPKCQNQNIADSDAPIAADLRRKVYELVNAGQSHNDVVDYMVQRYGSFVTYRPAVNALTAVLWYGPFVMIGLVALVLIIWVVRRSKATGVAELDDGERARLEKLLTANNGDPQ